MVSRTKIFKETLKLEDALKKLFESFKIPHFLSESVTLIEAKGRVLAKDIKSPINIPLFDKSAMDGYAVIAEDTFGASINNPITLKLIGKVKIGETPTIEVRNGTSVFVYTGSKMPQGADTVIMIEYTNEVKRDKIEIYSSVAPGQNISKIGEDVRENELILKRGMKLKFQDLGMLAAMGFSEIEVLKKLKIAILSTGKELVPVEKSGKSSQSRVKDIDINKITISTMCLDMGAEIVDLGIAKDDFKEIRLKIEKGLEIGDLVIVTGGTSVSDADLTVDAINSIGKPGMIVHGISIRPGKPTGLAIVSGKIIVSLSGYPIAAIVGFEALVKPILLRLQEIHEEPIPRVKAKMRQRVASTLGDRDYIRVRVEKSDCGFIATPVRVKGSGILSSMIKANGFLIIPENREGVDEGEETEINLFRPLNDII
jgi:molybdopterin molybdotransferase